MFPCGSAGLHPRTHTVTTSESTSFIVVLMQAAQAQVPVQVKAWSPQRATNQAFANESFACRTIGVIAENKWVALVNAICRAGFNACISFVPDLMPVVWHQQERKTTFSVCCETSNFSIDGCTFILSIRIIAHLQVSNICCWIRIAKHSVLIFIRCKSNTIGIKRVIVSHTKSIYPPVSNMFHFNNEVFG